VLREARLPDGRPAFNEREVFHMGEVRALVGKVLLAHAAALLVIVLGVVAGRLLDLGAALRRGLLAGSALTLGIAAVLGVYMLVNFDDFFVQFHEALFTGDTWRFPSSDTLIRLYPDAFWSDFAGVLAGLTVLQAALLAGALFWQRRRARAPLAATGVGAAGSP
jgi:integral membrane protein (TIGR01906 family)